MEKELKFVTENKIRLDDFLRTELPSELKKLGLAEKNTAADISNSKIRRLILAGAVHVNNRTVMRPAFELRGRSNVIVRFDSERFFFEKQPDDVSFELSAADILFEDENLIFLNKPSRFPVEQTITGNRNNLHDSLVDFLWRRNPSLRNPPYVGIMHRLDRTTSGVILFTKTRTVNAAVSELFKTHNLIKTYIAVVEEKKSCKGAEPLSVGKTFSVKMYMGRLTGKSQQGKWGELSQTRGGQFSHTDFKVIHFQKIEGRNCLVLECSLHTGRTHQIRVHLASCGLPILGDTLYGGSPANRLYLHSARLAFELENAHYDVSAPFLEFNENF